MGGKRYIAAINPSVYISAETEIWPNLYSELSKRNVPIIQVNGRISDNAYKGYRRFSFFTKRILKRVSFFCMQSELDAGRILSLGANREKVIVAGNLKFDSIPETSDITKADLGFHENNLLLIAGSTHPGEEVLISKIFMRLKPDFPQLNLILAPRHVERADDIVRRIEEMNLRAIKYSDVQKEKIAENKVIVVDTIGRLRSLYSLATVVFVGKSMVGSGGQNVIEPIFFGKPTFVGPNTENFRKIVDMLKKEGVLFQVEDQGELLDGIKRIISDLHKREEYCAKAKDVVASLKGATEKPCEL